MLCPKCEHDLALVDFNGVEIDRCTNCYGIWFDHLEQDDLKKFEGAESIDIGDEFMGAKYDHMQNVPCPRCAVAMNRVVHQASLEITFERCPQCKGSFFDAGEFRDYIDDEIFGEFQKLLSNLESIEPFLGESGQNLVDN